MTTNGHNTDCFRRYISLEGSMDGHGGLPVVLVETRPVSLGTPGPLYLRHVVFTLYAHRSTAHNDTLCSPSTPTVPNVKRVCSDTIQVSLLPLGIYEWYTGHKIYIIGYRILKIYHKRTETYPTPRCFFRFCYEPCMGT